MGVWEGGGGPIKAVGLPVGTWFDTLGVLCFACFGGAVFPMVAVFGGGCRFEGESGRLVPVLRIAAHCPHGQASHALISGL